jgi:hypothetical protein
MLRARGEEPPPTNYPPKTRHSSRRSEDASTSSKAAESRIIQHEQLPRGSQLSSHDDNPYLPFDSPKHNQSPHCNSNSTESPSIPPSLNTNGMVRRLLSTRGHLSFDQLSGRLRYFGPTTNCHVHSEFGDSMKSVHEHTEKSSRADKVIQILPLQTYEYLMELFWQCYNSVIHVLHQAAFDEDREKGQTQFYSSFLHVCVLAMGFRFADKDRADIRNLALPEKGSTLHHEAKCMLDYELERRGGIPSVVALLLLGDLECGVGRDNLGWLYGGMAVRLAFDIGYAGVYPSAPADMKMTDTLQASSRHATFWTGGARNRDSTNDPLGMCHLRQVCPRSSLSICSSLIVSDTGRYFWVDLQA